MRIELNWTEQGKKERKKERKKEIRIPAQIQKKDNH